LLGLLLLIQEVDSYQQAKLFSAVMLVTARLHIHNPVSSWPLVQHCSWQALLCGIQYQLHNWLDARKANYSPFVYSIKLSNRGQEALNHMILLDWIGSGPTGSHNNHDGFHANG